ncbi:phospholipase D family protein [Confluentibacter flavum]|uniref:Restriction endonuclease type II NgoFVII N-terminal domain-containing protein n=1 Tax=Confluentibacter flavum TaxID=1909700 RepID=A0A2N3HH23_9FLAO|nr:phospholipase D family protein [Confluentibacter flavum]PKQ44213.1 hypothetical protein CSW08_14010 [Confluentibacter flavum]
MRVTFLGQGYNLRANTSVAQVLIDSFANNSFHTFKCMVAFASPSGVSGLTEHINNSRTHIETTRVIIGVDQDATSREALERLLEWNANVFVLYSAQPNIFHPKIYIYEGENAVSIIIGSNNLTQMGLVKNIEGAVHITFNKDDIEGNDLLDDINTYFDPLLTGENPNLKPLTTALIEQLVEHGIVPTEAERRIKYTKDLRPPIQEGDNGNPRVNIRTLFPSIGLQNLPENFRPERRERILRPAVLSTENNNESLVVSAPARNYVEVWKSKPLTERDLNIPTGANTNPTGSMLLKKGLMKGIDHRNYFRNSVFADLNWQSHPNPAYTHLEKSSANFEIKIDGNSMGNFNLTINHNKATDTKAYKQKNAMTNLSWGNAKATIAKADFLDKTLTLFRDINSINHFVIEIE